METMKHIKLKKTSSQFVVNKLQQNKKINAHIQDKLSTKFICEYCDSNFSRIDSLTRHYKTCKKKTEIIELTHKLQKYEKYEKKFELAKKVHNYITA